MTKEKINKAVIYARISTGSGHIEDCLPCQFVLCQDFCDENDITVVGGYFDEGSSVSENRPALETVCELVRSGEINSIVVMSYDRIYRNYSDMIQFHSLLDLHNVTLHVVNTSKGDNELLSQAIQAELQHMTKVKKPQLLKKTPVGKKKVVNSRSKNK